MYIVTRSCDIETKCVKKAQRLMNFNLCNVCRNLFSKSSEVVMAVKEVRKVGGFDPGRRHVFRDVISGVKFSM